MNQWSPFELPPKYEEEVLLPLVDELRHKHEYLRRRPITVYGAVVRSLYKNALNKLFEKANVTSLSELELPLAVKALATIASTLNSALTLDFPYCICIVNIEDESMTGYAAIRRNAFPETTNISAPETVPFLYAETRADLMKHCVDVSVIMGIKAPPISMN